MESVAELVCQSLLSGCGVDWSNPRQPILNRVPTELADRLNADLDGLRPIMERAVLFRAQVRAFLQTSRALPTLAVPGYDGRTAGACISCGAPREHGDWRCDTCWAAVLVALHEPALGDGATRPQGGGQRER